MKLTSFDTDCVEKEHRLNSGYRRPRVIRLDVLQVGYCGERIHALHVKGDSKFAL